MTLPARQVELPSIEPTSDGWVGFNTNTRVQFESFLLMIGRLDLLEEDPSWALATTRWERHEEWNTIVRAWTTQRTTDEIVALASELRIPVAQVNNGQTILDHPHFQARGVWAQYPDGSFTYPLPPYMFEGARAIPRGEAPKLGQDQDTVRPRDRAQRGGRRRHGDVRSRECGSSTRRRGGRDPPPRTSSRRSAPK